MSDDKIIRIQDYERKSKNPDAAQPRDPTDATIIILPMIRSLNAPDDPQSHREMEHYFP